MSTQYTLDDYFSDPHYRTCEGCGKPKIHPSKPNVRFCRSCRRSQGIESKSGRIVHAALSTGKTGAIGELLVCADLIRQGYEVFRSVSQDASCDIIRLRGGVMERVEVRTGQRRIDGSFRCTTDGNYDVLAIVVENEIEYR